MRSLFNQNSSLLTEPSFTSCPPNTYAVLCTCRISSISTAQHNLGCKAVNIQQPQLLFNMGQVVHWLFPGENIHCVAMIATLMLHSQRYAKSHPTFQLAGLTNVRLKPVRIQHLLSTVNSPNSVLSNMLGSALHLQHRRRSNGLSRG